uniref:cytochrome c oxidase subunit II n=1 Tax=Asychis amphiglyptus TaxID=1931186 RepID=UPI0022DCE2F4|nr:cytochrome c oxidase subunit II [Asychis amphiglyptus]UZZ45803.1 cytochrome c oxidase subunit 2 [Asychis amphiglyptus]
MAHWGQMTFMDSVTPVMTQLIAFHDHVLLILTLVTTVVGYAMYSILKTKFICRSFTEAQSIELLWTILPCFLLLILAIPSIRLLYLMDEISNPSITIKAIGHQWYWTYEYSDMFNLEFDSYMIPTEDLKPGQFRLLEVDNRMVVPTNVEIRLLTTSSDVIHAWAIPALGVKSDAIPGRLNQLGFFINRPGVYFGQCSEICGANHTFMPIALEAVSYNSFVSWASSNSS